MHNRQAPRSQVCCVYVGCGTLDHIPCQLYVLRGGIQTVLVKAFHGKARLMAAVTLETLARLGFIVVPGSCVVLLKYSLCRTQQPQGVTDEGNELQFGAGMGIWSFLTHSAHT